MSHERFIPIQQELTPIQSELTHTNAIPLNRNMEGNQDPELNRAQRPQRPRRQEPRGPEPEVEELRRMYWDKRIEQAKDPGERETLRVLKEQGLTPQVAGGATMTPEEIKEEHDQQRAQAQNQNTEENKEREKLEPWGADIQEKLKNFYLSLHVNNPSMKFTEEQAKKRAKELSEQNALPEDQLFNAAGFTQEILQERIDKIVKDTALSNAQKEEKKNELIEQLTKGDLYHLTRLSAIVTDSRTGRQANVFNETDFKDAVEDANEKGIADLKRIFDSKVFNPIHRERDEATSESRGYNQYKSINEIAIDAMLQTEAAGFGRGGKYALVKTENGKEVFQEANFLEWVRNRMIEYHETDVDNPLDMFSGVYVAGGTRNVSLGEMLRVEAMFSDRERGYLKGMREQVYLELWLFNKSRNYDAQYRKIMGNDEKLPQVLQEFYYDNTFTKEETLDTIMTMPSSKKEINFEDKDGTRKENQSTGKAMRMALLAYYHISDSEMLNKIEIQTGNGAFQSALFNNEKFIDAYIRKEREGGSTDSPEDLRKKLLDKFSNKTAKFFQDGIGGLKKEIIEDPTQLNGYIDSLNPFSAANKDFDLKNETQERIRMFIMDATGISYDEAKYAETFAFSMARWTGTAARHDLRGSAYDSWTKVLLTEVYRARQSGENQGGIHGNPYSLGGFKRVGIDFLAGAKDVNQKSILEILQGGQGDEINLGDLQEKIKFGDRVMEKFGTDHIARAFKIYSDIIETHEFNFDKIVHFEEGTGRTIFDPKAANEFIDGYLKAMRYAYRTWPGIDYGKKIRIRTADKIETGDVVSSMFGDQVFREFVDGKDRHGHARRQSDTQTDGEVVQANRDEFWKRPLMYAIAAEIYAHIDYDSGFRRYSSGEIMEIYHWLEHISGQLEYDENDLRRTKRDHEQMFFSEDDIKWMRKASDSGNAGLIFKDAITYGITGVGEGAWKGWKAFLKSLGV